MPLLNYVASGTEPDQNGTTEMSYTLDNQIKTLKALNNVTGTPTTGISGTPVWEEDWAYDTTGNWGGGSTANQTKVTGTSHLGQYRSQNEANEITYIKTKSGITWPRIMNAPQIPTAQARSQDPLCAPRTVLSAHWRLSIRAGLLLSLAIAFGGCTTRIADKQSDSTYATHIMTAAEAVKVAMDIIEESGFVTSARLEIVATRMKEDEGWAISIKRIQSSYGSDLIMIVRDNGMHDWMGGI